MKKQYGKITILHENTIRKGVRPREYTLCACECGYSWYKITNRLKTINNCKRCYLNRNPVEPKMGDRFGKLIATGLHKPSKSGTKLYSCLCTCGETIWSPKDQLYDGTTTGCGNRCKIKFEETRVVAGQAFGHWTILSGVRHSHAGSREYEMICRCGKITWETAARIRKRTKGCSGCPKEQEDNLLKQGLSFFRYTTTGQYITKRHTKFFEVMCQCGAIAWHPKANLEKGRARQCRKCAHDAMRFGKNDHSMGDSGPRG